jgi:hypothetical protein
MGVLPMLKNLKFGTALTAISVATAIIGSATAAAQPADYNTLVVDPNSITDSLAYTAAPLDINPEGQQGVRATYNHRDGRQITTTVLFFPDPDAATASLAAVAADVVNPKTTPAAVGAGGKVVSGTSPDGVQSVTVLTFTEGNAATTIEFDGPAADPVPTDMAIDLAKKQDTSIRDWQSA